MMKHVSVFRLKPEYRTQEVINEVTRLLKELPAKVPAICSCEIGVKPSGMPLQSPDGHVQFYDIIQYLSFSTPQDCAAYPHTEGHDAFLAASSKYMEQVIVIDYPVE